MSRVATEQRTTRAGQPWRGLLVAGGADVVAVLVFVAAGRRSHSEGSALGGTLEVAWPFLVGVAVAWLIVLVTGLPPMGRRAGGLALACSVVIGMVLRAGVQHRDTPVAFILVATAFLGVFLLGWRAALSRRRPSAGR